MCISTEMGLIFAAFLFLIGFRIYFLRTLTQKIFLLSLVWGHGDTNIILSLVNISVCGDHISVELWVVVIKGIFSNVVPFGSGLIGSHNKFMLHLLFSNFNTIHSSYHIWVGSEVWNWVVDLSWLKIGLLWCWVKVLGIFT